LATLPGLTSNGPERPRFELAERGTPLVGYDDVQP
jgi:hypothetical protein